jgi:hypothetical protein
MNYGISRPGRAGTSIARAKPEHDDVAAAAIAADLPIGAVASQAIIALAELAGDAGRPGPVAPYI